MALDRDGTWAGPPGAERSACEARGPRAYFRNAGESFNVRPTLRSLGGGGPRLSPRPWDSDRPLTLETARAVVRASFSSIDVARMALLGSGWDFDAFVADGWVFRFPRRAECEALIERERTVLALVRPALPAGVAVPAVELVCPPTQGFPYRCAGHRFIDGEPADVVQPSLHPRLAADLASALGAVHGIPLDSAREVGLVEVDQPHAARADWLERGLRHAAELRGSDPVVDRAVRWLAEEPDPLRRLEAPARVIHNDLSPEHLVADRATGALVGILDWTDAVLGDPARDFVPLVAFGGWPLAEAVLARYPLPADPGFRDRLRFMARLLSVTWLGEARERGGDLAKHGAWVRNAFEDGSGS